METIMKCDTEVENVTRNIGVMLLNNRERYGGLNAFAEDENDHYRYWTWKQLVDDVVKFSVYLRTRGLQKGDHVGIISRNYYHRLVVELAVMASGHVCVPIFHRYTEEMMSHLLEFSDVKMLVLVNYWRLEYLPTDDKPILVMETPAFPRKMYPFEHQVDFFNDVMKYTRPTQDQIDSVERDFRETDPDETCMIMFTSGTTRFPKGVVLSHRNIMTQQAALEQLWNPAPGMRFLCYLPWHHSFGGLFERFFALHSGGCLAVDDSWGKDIDKLIRNFAVIKPHIYFSVPKVYKEIVSKVLVSHEVERIFFHDELRYVFTAAAPLDISISEIFRKKGVPVVEGWGLTETSPCCTLTALLFDRTPGVVGFPIPGVEIRLDEENEILVRGVNVMKGYYKLQEVTATVLDSDGWFKTGDIGAVTDEGLQIMGRKDRVFKLSNGEKVFPSRIERNIGDLCKFIKHAYIFGAGRDHPCALLFPNSELLESREISVLDDAECEHPDRHDSLTACFSRCLHKINCHQDVKFEHIQKAIIIDKELTIENDELTPSFKIIPRNIEKNYREYIDLLMSDETGNLPPDSYVVEICDCADGEHKE